MSDKEKEKEFDLLRSFHEQFAENQNHHQTVFIQFISAVLAVLVGYGFVYTNTSISADPFIVIRCKEAIISYSLIDLVGAYLIAQTILGLLVTLTANIGYGFRRDQFVNFRIRQKHIAEETYTAVFPANFDPGNKGWEQYLPEFNRMFIYALTIIQVLLIVSICLPAYQQFQTWKWWRWPFYFSLASPLAWSFYVYFMYYGRYKKLG
ncbi:MAG: hypothetical protein ABI308_09325 [Mucilaginibacter sp.]